MNKLLNKEYYHLGTNIILKELWLYPQMSQIYKSYIKPYGGLWTSHQNNHTLCDWIEYKEESIEPFDKDLIRHLDSTLIKFKEDSKLIKIENSNDYKNLKDSGFVKILEKPLTINKYSYDLKVTELIDYEKLCNLYEVIYVNPYAHNNLHNYSINTMFALKPNCIEYYKPIEVDIDNHKILSIETKKYIKEPTKEYYDLVDKVRNMFSDIKTNNYDEYVLNLYQEKEKLTNKVVNLINISNLKNINKLYLAKTILNNIYREKYLEKQKILKK